MTICSACQTTRTLPDCFEHLQVGTVGAANTVHYVYIKNITTGNRARYAATSNGSGLLTIETGNHFSPNHTFELTVTLASAASPDDVVNITLSGASAPQTCFSLNFEASFTEGVKNTFATVILKEA